MTPRTRSLAALGLTLALGLVLGVLLGGGLVARRVERLNTLAYPPHLQALLHEELDLSAAQAVAVDSVLESQSGQVSRRIQDHRDLMKRQMDSLLLALKPHLSAAQWQGLKERIAHFRPRRGPGGGPYGPGGPGGPGRHRGMSRQRGHGNPPADCPWQSDSLASPEPAEQRP